MHFECGPRTNEYPDKLIHIYAILNRNNVIYGVNRIKANRFLPGKRNGTRDKEREREINKIYEKSIAVLLKQKFKEFIVSYRIDKY